jgi:hypothetical protein
MPHVNNQSTHLLPGLGILGQLDLSHAAGANGLSERPCSGAGCGDGGPALVDGLRLARPGFGSYAIDGHCGSRRRVRRIPRVAPAGLFGAAWVFAAS